MNGFVPYPALNGGGNRMPHLQQRVPAESVSNPSSAPPMQTERNGALPMPVVGAQRQYAGVQNDMSGFGAAGVARSPPKNKSEYTHIARATLYMLTSSRYAACPLQILPSRSVPSWPHVPFLTRCRVFDAASTMQILHQRWM